ncbi:PTS sugar transporter subunit IIC, partial [Enterococcus faecalis]|nr:PTS sugar transporter subunit IIC [Enterococcus faecalis]
NIATLPSIIVGSSFLTIALSPLPASWCIPQFLTSNGATSLLPFRITMYIMALFASFSICASLANSNNLDPRTGLILATRSFWL